MKRLLLLIIIISIGYIAQAQNIAAARSAPIGSTVTVKGIITNGSELGVIRYLQDNTAGIAAYGGTASASGFTTTSLGDSVSITGVTKLYNNLLEIDPVTSFTIIASGKPVPAPVIITPSAMNESVESQLVKIQNCTFQASGNFTTSSANYTATSNSQNFVVRIVGSASSIAGSAIPSGAVDITGIASQFCSSPSTGCTTGFQLIPRTNNDIMMFSGINEINYFLSANVYPNPANEKLNFTLNNSNENVQSISVLDINGKMVLYQLERSTSISISSLSPGVYFIKIQSDKHQYTSKFIVLN